MSFRMLTVPMVVLALACVGRAQDAVTPAVAPEGDKTSGDDPTAMSAKWPITETVEPLVAEDGATLPTAEQIVAKGLAYMGAERLAAAKSLEFQRYSLLWRNQRLLCPEDYRTQARVQWPPIARVIETQFDMLRRKPREMMFIQYGSDAFQQSGFEVHASGGNEVATKLRVSAELGTPLLVLWIQQAKVPLVLDGRATVQTFVPKTFKPMDPGDKGSTSEEGFFDYEPATRTYLQVTAELPADMAEYFGATVVMFFDETDGRLARIRYIPQGRREYYANREMNFDIETYGAVAGPDGKPSGVKIPTLVYVTLDGSAERQETLEIRRPTIDKELADGLFRRP